MADSQRSRAVPLGSSTGRRRKASCSGTPSSRPAVSTTGPVPTRRSASPRPTARACAGTCCAGTTRCPAGWPKARSAGATPPPAARTVQRRRPVQGRVAAWDAIDEPIADTGGKLRRSRWMNALGPGYIAHALRWAHEADPDAKLYVNDGGAWKPPTRKATTLYNASLFVLAASTP